MEPATSNPMKLKLFKDISIPYILNGELYEILTQDGENVTVKCCHCPPDRVYRGSVRSTGNFHMHIKRRHPELLGKLHEMKVSSLVVRRERLVQAKKLAFRNRIKKEELGPKEVAETMQFQNNPSSQPIDCSQRSDTDESLEALNQMNLSPMNTEREPNIIITTEIDCETDSDIHALTTPMYFPPIKEEAAINREEQAMDLTTSNKPVNIHAPNMRWDQILQRVDNALKDIQHELRTRNQIEMNHIFLDLAKFKYQNPDFRY